MLVAFGLSTSPLAVLGRVVGLAWLRLWESLLRASLCVSVKARRL